MLWKIDQGAVRKLNPVASFQKTLSTNDDPCHFELNGLTNAQGRNVFNETWKPEQTFVCNDNDQLINVDNDQLMGILSVALNF